MEVAIEDGAPEIDGDPTRLKAQLSRTQRRHKDRKQCAISMRQHSFYRDPAS